METLEALELKSWWTYLGEDIQKLLQTSEFIYKAVESWGANLPGGEEQFHDYSFVVFPAAKAYEGFLKKIFLRILRFRLLMMMIKKNLTNILKNIASILIRIIMKLCKSLLKSSLRQLHVLMQISIHLIDKSYILRDRFLNEIYPLKNLNHKVCFKLYFNHKSKYFNCLSSVIEK